MAKLGSMTTVAPSIDYRALWDDALPYDAFVAASAANRALWEGVYRTARVPEWALRLACERGRRVRLLAIVEDWCGDASNTVPILAKLGDAARCLDLKVVRRDEHPALMDRYLTNGTRSIPIVIALDADFQPLGRWGPRPRALQEWFLAHRDAIPKDERYREMRKWYAKDRGASTLKEVLELIG